MAISEIKEAHDQETGNEPSSEGDGTRVKGKAHTGTKELIYKEQGGKQYRQNRRQ